MQPTSPSRRSALSRGPAYQLGRGHPWAVALARRARRNAYLRSRNASCLKDGALGTTRHKIAEESDLLLVLGGDGTLLAAAREAAARAVPVLPINMGSLGFLTSFTVEELYPALENVLAGRATINERVLLLVERVNAGQIVTQQRVLNDAVVHKARWRA